MFTLCCFFITVKKVLLVKLDQQLQLPDAAIEHCLPVRFMGWAGSPCNWLSARSETNSWGGRKRNVLVVHKEQIFGVRWCCFQPVFFWRGPVADVFLFSFALGVLILILWRSEALYQRLVLCTPVSFLHTVGPHHWTCFRRERWNPNVRMVQIHTVILRRE